LLLCATPAASSLADEAAIRRNLPARLPDLPAIDEVRPAAMPGLWEVRLGNDVIYSDGEGAFVLEGDLIDTRHRVNLTDQRETALKHIDLAALPLQEKDRGATWRNWMINGVAPAAAATCDTSALTRNLALQRRHGVAGTPSLVFDDGERIAGVIDADQFEQKFASLKLKPRG
jgi:hypothetical protein